MKKFVLLFTVLFSVCFFGQSADQKKIQEDSRAFVKYFQDKNYDGIFSATYPALFEKFDRDMLEGMFEQMFAGNAEFSTQILADEGDRYEVSEIFQSKNGGKYAFVVYPSRFQMNFKKAQEKEAQDLMVKLMADAGISAVFTDATTLRADKSGMMVAINDKKTSGTWKYLNHDEGNAMYSSLLAEDIMKKANEYYQKTVE